MGGAEPHGWDEPCRKHLLLHGMLNSRILRVSILQGHIDEVDESLETARWKTWTLPLRIAGSDQTLEAAHGQRRGL